jgi:hypothetical protein
MRALLFASLLVGCTGLTAGGERVRVLDANSASAGEAATTGCRYIGTVKGRAQSTKPGSPLTGNFAIARESAVNDLRNNAAENGADTVVNVQTTDDFWGVDARAEAYACGANEK